MGHRQDILGIFTRRAPPPRPVVALRLDLWHRDAASRGALEVPVTEDPVPVETPQQTPATDDAGGK